ncbi:unnamed protein product [Cylindrotheca closterium]|uniref:Uncharacterized protein n=1 Tax=Cylindrotheca closterium TaxID=2856 RepID=A0AAD2G1U8_9STRA|nr:unnamed protein product [Cylindrotheca closterium]
MCQQKRLHAPTPTTTKEKFKHAPTKERQEETNTCKRWNSASFHAISTTPPDNCEKYGGWSVHVTEEEGYLCELDTGVLMPGGPLVVDALGGKVDTASCRERTYYSREKKWCSDNAMHWTLLIKRSRMSEAKEEEEVLSRT